MIQALFNNLKADDRFTFIGTSSLPHIMTENRIKFPRLQWLLGDREKWLKEIKELHFLK